MCSSALLYHDTCPIVIPYPMVFIKLFLYTQHACLVRPYVVFFVRCPVFKGVMCYIFLVTRCNFSVHTLFVDLMTPSNLYVHRLNMKCLQKRVSCFFYLHTLSGATCWHVQNMSHIFLLFPNHTKSTWARPIHVSRYPPSHICLSVFVYAS